MERTEHVRSLTIDRRIAETGQDVGRLWHRFVYQAPNLRVAAKRVGADTQPIVLAICHRFLVLHNYQLVFVLSIDLEWISLLPIGDGGVSSRSRDSTQIAAREVYKYTRRI